MASNPADATDVAARWRPLSDAEATVASALLADAWAILNVRVTDLETRLDAGTLDAQIVVAVECAMVLRVLKNPDGFRSRSETVDDYSTTYTGAGADGALSVTDSELLLLSSAGSTTRSRRLVAYGDYT